MVALSSSIKKPIELADKPYALIGVICWLSGEVGR